MRGSEHAAETVAVTATKKGQTAAPGTIGFHGVPEGVWNFDIGGYQVCAEIYDAVKQAIVDARESDSASLDRDREYAKKVIERVEGAREALHSESKEMEFRYVVHLIELLSASLIDDPTTEHEN